MNKELFISTLVIIGYFAVAQYLQSLIDKANKKINSNDLECAKNLLHNALGVDPSFAPGHIEFSKVWLRKGNLSKANKYATLAIRIDAQFRPWWEKLGEIRFGIQIGQKYV